MVPIVGTEEALTQRTLHYLSHTTPDQAKLAEVRAELRHNAGDLVAQTADDLENNIFREVSEMVRQRQMALYELQSLLVNKYGEDAAYKVTTPYYSQFIDLCLGVLRKLDREEVFGSEAKRKNVIVNLLFDDQDVGSMVATAKELNSKQIVDRYIKELHQHYPGLSF